MQIRDEQAAGGRGNSRINELSGGVRKGVGIEPVAPGAVCDK
jgi:hypothetical protein